MISEPEIQTGEHKRDLQFVDFGICKATKEEGGTSSYAEQKARAHTPLAVVVVSLTAKETGYNHGRGEGPDVAQVYKASRSWLWPCRGASIKGSVWVWYVCG